MHRDINMFTNTTSICEITSGICVIVLDSVKFTIYVDLTESNTMIKGTLELICYAKSLKTHSNRFSTYCSDDSK